MTEHAPSNLLFSSCILIKSEIHFVLSLNSYNLIPHIIRFYGEDLVQVIRTCAWTTINYVQIKLEKNSNRRTTSHNQSINLSADWKFVLLAAIRERSVIWYESFQCLWMFMDIFRHFKKISMQMNRLWVLIQVIGNFTLKNVFAWVLYKAVSRDPRGL